MKIFEKIVVKRVSFLFAYSLPAIVMLSFHFHGIWTFLPVFVFFGFIPLIELILKPDSSNLNTEQSIIEKNFSYYDWILYFAVPVQIFTLLYFLTLVSKKTNLSIELVGNIISMGMMCGVFGINIGHELGHRKSRVEQLFGEIMLLTSLNTHFLPYHNAGHHKNVATHNDPATAQKGQILYFFWFSSHFKSYYQAWIIEKRRLLKKKSSAFSFQNKMVIYTLANLILLLSILLIFNVQTLLYFCLAATVGIILLETINYIEHYGLVRKLDDEGKYEKVTPIHSWNSNHTLGRLLLFNLSRHSDHHYLASKKYQILNSMPQSPQMAAGYPGMVLLALFQPLWFVIMNKKLKELSNT